MSIICVRTTAKPFNFFAGGGDSPGTVSEETKDPIHSSIILVTISSIFSRCRCLNRGSKKEATERVLKTGLPISYLFCKSDLIMSFKSFINLLSPLAGSNYPQHVSLTYSYHLQGFNYPQHVSLTYSHHLLGQTIHNMCPDRNES